MTEPELEPVSACFWSPVREQKHPAQHHKPEGMTCDVADLGMAMTQMNMEKCTSYPRGTRFPPPQIACVKSQFFLWPPCVYKY